MDEYPRTYAGRIGLAADMLGADLARHPRWAALPWWHRIWTDPWSHSPKLGRPRQEWLVYVLSYDARAMADRDVLIEQEVTRAQ